jgi:PAS domain S-box-containing protein
MGPNDEGMRDVVRRERVRLAHVGEQVLVAWGETLSAVDVEVAHYADLAALPDVCAADVLALQVDDAGPERVSAARRRLPTTPVIALVPTVDAVRRRALLDAGAWEVAPAGDAARLLATVWACVASHRPVGRGALADQRARRVIEAASEGVVGMDSQGRVTEWNAAAETIFGWSAAEVMGRELGALIIPEPHREAHRAGLARARRTGQAPVLRQRLELAGLHASGHEVPIEMNIASFLDGAGEKQFCAVIHDVSLRRKAEDRLQASEHRFRSLFENAALAVAVVDERGRLVDVNQSMCGFVGYERPELLRMSLRELTHPDDLASSVAQLKALRAGEGDNFQMEKRYLHQDGRVLIGWISVARLPAEDGAPSRTFAIIEDVTGRRAAEEQIRRAHRLEAVGRLAGGAAHQVNTPLQYLSDNLGFVVDGVAALGKTLRAARELVPDGHPARAHLAHPDVELWLEDLPGALRDARDGVMSVARVVNALRAFSAEPGSSWRAVDLNEMVGQILSLTRPGPSIRLSHSMASEMPLVTAQASELRQVVLGLVFNAIDALTSRPEGGLIEVTTEAEDGWVHLRVQDDGPGIPVHLQAHLFDPFFSTRTESGKLGIGLAQAHAVVVGQHGGRVALDSTPGQGTCVQISLPTAG